jgi:carbamoyl-phosphate synthase large subunit
MLTQCPLSFIDIATCAIVGQDVPEPIDLMAQKRDYVAIKVPQFSWTRLAGADPFLGVGESSRFKRLWFLSDNVSSAEMASTGEVASFGNDLAEAYWASIASTTGFRVPERNKGVLLGGDISKPELGSCARRLYDCESFQLHVAAQVI